MRQRQSYNAGMWSKAFRVLALAFLLAASAARLALAQSPLKAHWLTEPATAGQANTIVVTADAQADLAGLQVSVTHGDQEQALTVAGDAGQLSAAYTPPSAGSYGVHVTGSLNGQAVDERLALADVRETTIGLPAIQVEAPEPVPGEAPAGPNWILIGGSALAVVLLVAAVLVGRIKR